MQIKPLLETMTGLSSFSSPVFDENAEMPESVPGMISVSLKLICWLVRWIINYLIVIIQLGKGSIKRRLLGVDSSTRIDLPEKPHVSTHPGYFRVDHLGILPPCSFACQNLG